MAPSPQHPRANVRWIVLAVVALVATLSAAPLQGVGPPDVAAGTKIYGIEMERPSRELWPTAGPATPFTVQGVRGSWLLLDSPAIQRGPVWVNFDQVITFRHNP